MSREILFRQIKELENQRKINRARERSLRSRAHLLSAQPVIKDSGTLRKNLEKIIPKHLSPTNIGKLNEVEWFFWFPLDFDFGTDPTYTETTRQSRQFQVDQEAGFLLTHISRTHDSSGPSGAQAPLQMTLRDNQSSRQFNDAPIPLQFVGSRGDYLELDTPLFIAPNSTFSVEMTSWLSGDFPTTGSGKHQITLGGYRMRAEDASKVLTSIFA
jgi:hypothetical protein